MSEQLNLMTEFCSRRRSWIGPAVLIVGLLSSGCQSSGFDRTAARSAAPAPFVIGVAQLQVSDSAGQGSADGLSLTPRSPGALHQQLVDSMRDLRTGSDVVLLSGADEEAILIDASEQEADIVVFPRLDAAQFGESDVTSTAYLSGLLWLTTWVGSLWIEDTEYQTQVAFHCKFQDPSSSRVYAAYDGSTNDTVRLGFLERNKAFSKRFFLSMLLPPFWVTEDPERTSEGLTGRAMDQVAAELKTHLSGAMGAGHEHLGSIKILAPVNGSRPGRQAQIELEFDGPGSLVSVQMYVNDDPTPAFSLRDDELRTRVKMVPESGSNRCTLDPVDLPLTGRDDKVKIRAMINNNQISRTLTLN